MIFIPAFHKFGYTKYHPKTRVNRYFKTQPKSEL